MSVNKMWRFQNRNCPTCRKPLLFEPSDLSRKQPNWRDAYTYDLYCGKCDDYYISRFKNFGYKSLKETMKSGAKVRQTRRPQIESFGKPTVKQIQMLEDYRKEEHISSIIPDHEFHKYYCNVVKDVTGNDCKCYGKDLPK
jgi:hypothetical protein